MDKAATCCIGRADEERRPNERAEGPRAIGNRAASAVVRGASVLVSEYIVSDKPS